MAEILGCHDNFTQRWQTKTRLHKIDDRRSRTHVGRHQISEGEREVEKVGGKRNKGWEENGGIRDNEVESS